MITYKQATIDAFASATFSMKTLSDVYKVEFEYGQMGHILNVIKSLHLNIKEKVFEASPFVLLEIPKSQTKDKIIQLKAKILQVSEEQIDEDTEISFCTIEPI